MINQGGGNAGQILRTDNRISTGIAPELSEMQS